MDENLKGLTRLLESKHSVLSSIDKATAAYVDAIYESLKDEPMYFKRHIINMSKLQINHVYEHLLYENE